MNVFRALTAALGLTAAPCSNAQPLVWPDLPTNGFIVGRAATLEDAKAGNAVFSMNGTGLGAIPIQVPQYSYWTDERGTKQPMIVVQAEKASDGSKIIGLRGLDSSEAVATLAEVELLGTRKPAQ